MQSLGPYVYARLDAAIAAAFGSAAVAVNSASLLMSLSTGFFLFSALCTNSVQLMAWPSLENWSRALEACLRLN